MRLEQAALILGAALLLLLGLRPDSLPFAPGARFSDAALAHWPAALRLRQSVLFDGEFPVWQDTIMGGQPFAANPLNKTAYPFQWLVLLLPPTPHLNALVVLHLLLGGLGMWRWARALGLLPEAAAVSAFAYALAPRALGHLGAGHLDLIYALAWWPWLMLSAGALGQLDRTPRRVLQTGLFAGLLLLADLRLSLFALALAGGYALWQAACARRWRAAWRLLPAGAIAGGLALAVILPLLAWGPHLSRGDLDSHGAALYSLEPLHLVGLALPPRAGTPETFTYLGLVTLNLAAIGLLAGWRARWFWLAAALVAGMYAFGANGPLWPLLTEAMPALRWFRVPARAWLVVGVCAALLAGHGAQAVMDWSVHLRRGGALSRLRVLRLAAGGLAGGALLCGGFSVAAAGLDPLIGLGTALVGLLTAGTLLLALYGIVPQTWAAWALLVILAFDSGWTGAAWLEWRGPESWLRHQDDLAEALATADRVYSPNYALEQQVAAERSLRLFGGVDPFQLRGLAAAVAQASGVMTQGYSVTQPPLVGADADEALETANCGPAPDLGLLAQWRVSHIVSRCPLAALEAAGASLRAVGRIYVYNNPAYTETADLNTAGWPMNWPGLPNLPVVEDFNRLTVGAALFSSAALFICLIALVWGFAHEP
ncbi:MAG: hypothetical protein ACUVSX_06195 [Aggregatilineales bacterium]